MPNNRQRLPNNSGVVSADAELVAELLVDLDIGPGAEPEPLTPADLVELGVTVSSHFAAAVAKGRAKRDRDYEAKGEEIRRKSAAAEREWYRLDKIARTGTPPRDYEKHPDIAPQQPGETPDEYRKRRDRDRKRKNRGVTAEQIEARAAEREAMTPEDRKKKKASDEAARRAKRSTKDQSEARDARRKRQKEREAAEAQAKVEARAIV